MKKGICLLLGTMILFSCAMAEREVRLPNSRYLIEVPDWMRYSKPEEKDMGVEAYISEMLEIDYMSYPLAALVREKTEDPLRVIAEDSAAKGKEVELRRVGGIEMLCFRTVDEADRAPCIGYVFLDGEWLVEIDFWYATQEAADLTGKIISSVRETE